MRRWRCGWLVVCATCLTIGSAEAQWAEWGGPSRDFKLTARELSIDWGATGPKEFWRRDLGEGYSAIGVDEGVLYTMYRRGSDEVVVALDAQTGKGVWEFAYAAPEWEGFNTGYGPGPHSTTMVVEGRVYAIGVRSLLHCLEKKTGKVV